MKQGWEGVVGDLERATARLAGINREDFLEIAQAMNERSAAIARLREFAANPSEPLEPPILDRLKADYKNGIAASEKLLLLRAAARAELSRSTESGFFVRSLAGVAASVNQRIDCIG